MKKRLGIMIFIAVDLLILLAVVLITFSHTKDYYKVRFDLNGGTLISGNLEQTIRFGNNAIPPVVTKDGEIFLEWSDDFTTITEDKVIYALWDHESTFGLEFEVYWNGNFSLVSGAFDSITGDIYVSAYYQERRVLGVKDGAFLNCNRMNSITLPDGMYSIGNSAFNGCTSLTSIDLPNSLVSIGDNAFSLCKNLTSISLPDTVVSIGKYAFSNCENLKTIEIGSNIEDICGETFYGMHSLEEIIVSDDNPYYQSIDGNLYSKDGKTLIKYATGKKDEVFMMPESVEVISEFAFDNAVNLKKINISNNLYEIKSNAIYQCENIEYTNLDGISYIGNDTNPYLILLSANELTQENVVLPENVKIIYRDAFKDCTMIQTLEIGKGLRSIGDGSFAGCTSLKEIQLPITLVSIGAGAFYSCTSLEKINIPSNVTKLGHSVFINCINLKEVVLSKNLELIDENAFYNCASLETIELPNTLEEIGASAFYGCIKLKEMNVPKNVKKIGIGFIQNCQSLQKLTIPFIGPEVDSTSNGHFGYFFGSTKYSSQEVDIPSTLVSVTISNEVKINSFAFYYCNSLKEIYLPKTLREVGGSAFIGCTNLKKTYFAGNADEWCNISFGDTSSLPNYYSPTIYFLNENNDYELVEEIVLTDRVSVIHDYQFANFGDLKRIVISNKVKELPVSTFRSCKALESVYIGDSVETIYYDAFHLCPLIQEFEVSSNNQYLMSHNGNIYSKDGKTLFFANKSISNSNFEVLDSVERIEKCAFYNNPVKTIVFSKNLKSIGEYAFYGCEALLDFVLPESLEIIEQYSFYGSKLIENIVIPNSVTTVGPNSFYGCTGLISVTLSSKMEEIAASLFYNCTSLKTVLMPDSIKSIGNSAFRNCRFLENIILSNNLKSIGSYAFSGCIKLTNLYIPISVQLISRYAIYNCPLLNIKCEAEPMPDGWHQNWARGYDTLVWSVENPRKSK